ncbi:MAG: toxin of toxin-antitoxin system [Desulfuromonas sp. SDB]|nr:MAG: toxin of toxin-antitoxin system [Desulfuromonas sp. SDB]
MPYRILFTKEAIKDIEKQSPKIIKKLKEIIKNQISIEPYSGKKLVGDLKGFYSIRLNYRDRIVYSIDEKSKVIYIHKTRTHYHA